MAKLMDRVLEPSEVVHHVDGDNKNNAIDNLMLFVSQAKHLAWHHSLRAC